MNRLFALCGVIVLISGVALALDAPDAVVSLFAGQQTIQVDDAKAARGVVGASATKLASDVTAIYRKQADAVARYERVRRQIERLQAMLVEINAEIVALDKQRLPLESAQEDAAKSAAWLDEAVRDAEADKAADIPLDATAYLQYIETVGGEK